MNNVDVMDDMQPASLKSIEGTALLSYRRVPYLLTIPDKLTEEQIAEMVKYCISDVKG